MELKNVKYEVKENIAYVTIDRPKVNALNSETLGEINTAMLMAQDDNDVAGVIITGAGEKFFVAGADIGEISESNAMTGMNFARFGQEVFDAIENFCKPVIAAVNGFSLGGGCELAMACHMRVASDNAVFGQPEVKLGIIPGYGGTQRLPRLVGKGRALELILVGEPINAEEAHRIGLVNKVVPQDKLIETCETMLKDIMARGPLAVRMALEAVNSGLNMTLPEAIVKEANLFGLLCATEDKSEGTKAFLEKRDPNFKGE